MLEITGKHICCSEQISWQYIGIWPKLHFLFSKDWPTGYRTLSYSLKCCAWSPQLSIYYTVCPFYRHLKDSKNESLHKTDCHNVLSAPSSGHFRRRLPQTYWLSLKQLKKLFPSYHSDMLMYSSFNFSFFKNFNFNYFYQFKQPLSIRKTLTKCLNIMETCFYTSKSLLIKT